MGWTAFNCNPVAGINVSYVRFWKTTDKFKLNVSFCCNLMFVPVQFLLSVSVSSHRCVCLSLGTKTIWFGLGKHHGLARNTCSGCHYIKKKDEMVWLPVNNRWFRSLQKRMEKRPHRLKLQLPAQNQNSFVSLAKCVCPSSQRTV